MRIRKSEKLDLLFSAMAKVQANVLAAIKDSENPNYDHLYSSLEAVWEACRDQLVQNGFCILQTGEVDEKGEAGLVTILGHSSGQWIEGFFPLAMSGRKDPQAQGSAITYLRRYSLAAIVGVFQNDDDAENAMDRETPPAQPPSRPHAQRPGLGRKQMQGDRRPPIKPIRGGGECCELCDSVLVMSFNGKSLYCPNYKDKSRGDHSRVPVTRSA